MEKTIEELNNLILKKEDAYKNALEQMEIALILFKNRFFDYFKTISEVIRCHNIVL